MEPLINHLERKMIFQTSMIMFHVNLPGFRVNFSKPRRICISKLFLELLGSIESISQTTFLISEGIYYTVCIIVEESEYNTSFKQMKG